MMVWLIFTAVSRPGCCVPLFDTDELTRTSNPAHWPSSTYDCATPFNLKSLNLLEMQSCKVVQNQWFNELIIHHSVTVAHCELDLFVLHHWKELPAYLPLLQMRINICNNSNIILFFKSSRSHFGVFKRRFLRLPLEQTSCFVRTYDPVLLTVQEIMKRSTPGALQSPHCRLLASRLHLLSGNVKLGADVPFKPLFLPTAAAERQCEFLFCATSNVVSR